MLPLRTFIPALLRKQPPLTSSDCLDRLCDIKALESDPELGPYLPLMTRDLGGKLPLGLLDATKVAKRK